MTSEEIEQETLRGRSLPPAVASMEFFFWTEPPDRLSERCLYWVDQICCKGWLPSVELLSEGYWDSAATYGVYLWEYLHVLSPLIKHKRDAVNRGTKL